MELITHLHVAGELQRAHLLGVYTAATLLDHRPDSGAHHPLTSLRGAAVYHYSFFFFFFWEGWTFITSVQR